MIHPNPKPEKKHKKKSSIPKRLVKEVFERDHNICQYCGCVTAGLDKDSLLPSAHCHHIIKRRKVEGHKVELLNCCCWNCHARHGEITKVDKRWLNGENVYKSGRLKEELWQGIEGRKKQRKTDATEEKQSSQGLLEKELKILKK